MLAAPRAPVGVVDLRAPDADPAARAAIVKAIGLRPGVALPDAPLASALDGETDPAPLAAAAALRDEAIRAYGEQGCAAAGQVKDAAFALLRAAPVAEVKDRLERPLEILLVCADAAKQTDVADGAARRLRAIGVDPPPGVPADVWARHPAQLMQTVTPARFTIDADPADAQVSIDLGAAAAAPIDFATLPGDVWIVASAPGRERSVSAVSVSVTQVTAVKLALAPSTDRWQAVRARVAAWRRGGNQPAAADISALMRDAGLQVMVTLPASGAAQIWTLGAHEKAARAAGGAAATDPDAIAQAVSGAIAVLGGASDGARNDLTVAVPPKKPHRSPWVWAAVAGAVVVGAGVVYFTQSAGNTQKIEIDFP